MALILGVREGKDFFVGDNRIKVLKIQAENRFEIQVGKPGHLERHVISEEESKEVLPDIRLSAGLHGTPDLARVVIDAPEDVKILRGHIYRQEHVRCSP